MMMMMMMMLMLQMQQLISGECGRTSLLLLTLSLLQLFCTGLVVAPDATTDSDDNADSNDISADGVPHLGALQGTFMHILIQSQK